MMTPPPGLDKNELEKWNQDLNLHMICPDCKEFPPNLVEEFSSGDMVCGSCGLVLGDRIVDTRSEWRTFSNDDQGNDDPSRVGEGANPLLNGSQLATTIAFGEGFRSHELHRAHGRSTADKATKTLLAAYKEIGAHCDAVSIPKNVSDAAKHLFKIVDDAKAMKGKSQESIIAGCIFIACRQCGVPRTFREVYALTKVSKKEIGRTFKALEKFFNQDSLGKQALAAASGKFEGFDYKFRSILTVLCKASKPKLPSRVPNLLAPAISASVTAPSLASSLNSSSKSRKVWPRRCQRLVISLAVPLCQWLPLASTWPRTCLASQRARRRFLLLQVLVTAPSALHTNICIRSVSVLSSLTG